MRISGCRDDWTGSLSAPLLGGPLGVAARNRKRSVCLACSELLGPPIQGTSLVLGTCMPQDHMMGLLLTTEDVWFVWIAAADHLHEKPKAEGSQKPHPA